MHFIKFNFKHFSKIFLDFMLHIWYTYVLLHTPEWHNVNKENKGKHKEFVTPESISVEFNWRSSRSHGR